MDVIQVVDVDNPAAALPDDAGPHGSSGLSRSRANCVLVFKGLSGGSSLNQPYSGSSGTSAVIPTLRCGNRYHGIPAARAAVPAFAPTSRPCYPRHALLGAS